MRSRFAAKNAAPAERGGGVGVGGLVAGRLSGRFNEAAASRPRSSPDAGCGLRDCGELAALVVLGDRVADDRGGEAARGAGRETLERHDLRGLSDPLREPVDGLDARRLGGDEAEHDDLVVAYVLEGFEVAASLVVVLEQEAVRAHALEDRPGDRLVASGDEPARSLVAP